jgi:hypothetical protein
MSERKDYQHLLRDLQENPGLRAELGGADQGSASLAHWAKARGYEISEREAAVLLESLNELSDDDLDKVAGGDAAWGGTTTGTGGGTPPPPP